MIPPSHKPTLRIPWFVFLLTGEAKDFFVGMEAMWVLFFFLFSFFLSFLAICQCGAEVQKVTPKIINHWGDVWIVVNFVNE